MRPLLALLALVMATPGHAGTPLEDATREDAAVVALVQHAATAALLREVGTLDDALVDARRIDAEREQERLAPSGLRDNVQLLAAGLRPTRDARRDALEGVLDDDPDDIVERLAKHAIDNEDDAGAADRLLGDDRHNRRATVVNDAIRPLGLFSGAAFLAALNPLILAGSAIDSLATTAINLYHYNDLSPREREALVRYRRQLARDPDTTATPEIVEVVHAINARRNVAQCSDSLRAGEQSLEAGDLDRARFFATSAGALDGCRDKAMPLRDRVSAAVATEHRRAEAARWPADEATPPPADETDDYHALLVSTVLGDAAGMMATAQTFSQHHLDSDRQAAATLAIAVARDLAGHRTGAESALRSIAGEACGPCRVASAMLDSPRFGRLDPLASAERHHAREVAEYVLVGGGIDGRTALYTASQLGAQGLQAAESFGIFNVISMVTRGWSAWRKDPASNQAIIDEGERFLVSEPGAVEASEVHERLADAYDRAHAYDRALLHYRATVSPDPKRIAALEEQIADQLLENAGKAAGEPALLAAIVQHYPMTDAAEKARTALKALPRPGEVPISREVLVAHPELLGPSAFDLGPELLDGKADNTELADEGLIIGPGTLSLKLQDPDGTTPRTETRVLTPDAYLRCRAAAEEALYTSALATDPDAGKVGRFERYIPFFIAGSVEDGGVTVAPGLKLHRDTSEERPLYQ